MNTKKLDKWAELLLDTGKRNNLINFKDRKAMTVEVLSPSSDVLFEKIDGSASFEVYDPKIVEEDDEAEYSDSQEQPSAALTAADEIADSNGQEQPSAAPAAAEEAEGSNSQEQPSAVPTAEEDEIADSDGKGQPSDILAAADEIEDSDGQGQPSAASTAAGEIADRASQEQPSAVPTAADDETEDRAGQEQPSAVLPPKDEDSTNKKKTYYAQYSGKMRRQNQLLLYNEGSGPLAAVKNIDKKSRAIIEETGVNVAYMAFGFIHWKENGASTADLCAPILLVPIQLEQASVADPYIIRSTEDDIIVNPTFAYKMDTEYGIKLPEYDDEGLVAYLETIRKIVSRLRWTVSAECKIGIFSFLKINMYRDLKDNAEKILENPNVCQLLGEPIELPEEEENEGTVDDPLIELHSVVDADSSQIEAIEMAKSGKSFVLQGPPGTGKSQTITNIIAECLGDGKKVLFVSEKLAALSVVYDKLKQAGLSEFCLELHSHKANKKDVIADICHTLRASKSIVSSKAKEEIAVKQKAEKQLDAYAVELHCKCPGIEKSLYQLYGAHAALEKEPKVEWAVPQLASCGDAYLSEVVLLLEQYVDYIPSIGYDYRKNPWYGYVHQDLSYQAKNEVRNHLSSVADLAQSLVPLLREISEQYEIPCVSIGDAYVWKTFFDVVASSKIITPGLLQKERFDTVYSAVKALQEKSADLLSSRSVLEAVFDKDIYKIDGEAYYKKLTRQFGGVFSRLFQGEYRQLMADLRLCKKDGKKLSYDEAVAMMERLAYYQQKSEEFLQAEAPIKEYMGEAYQGIETPWDYVTEQMEALQTIFSKEIHVGKLAQYTDFSSEKEAFANYAQALGTALQVCDREMLDHAAAYFDSDILNIKTMECAALQNRIGLCLREMDKVDNWCHFRSLLSQLKEQRVDAYIDTVIAQNVEPNHMVGAFKRLFYFQWIDRIVSSTPVLSNFHRISQDKVVRVFSEKDVEQFEINKAIIRAELSNMRPSLDMIAPGSALAILLREGEKKRRQKSIRSLLAEAGEVIQRVKPCFLMSPLSVSTFLAPDAVDFDVVIFDEASQIFPQDAMGAIYRAKQLIVVGDSKQMPPSNFFNATIEAENDDEETGDVTDFESILDLCTTSMRQLRLRWHYRSRYEQLITFSNKNFYDNDLITFPSAKAETQGIGVDYYHVDGIFDRKSHTNRKEAEYIVDLIYKNIEQYPERSLGVVAFSVAQQDLIDKLLSKRRQGMPEKEFFFRNDKKEPFFIKNLETVQGDERDTIIFSTAYGLDAQGRLLHNFGPLNRVGGERRLNVAVTRAKCNVQLVSSMHYTDIDLKRTSAEGARLLREYLDFAENGEIALERSVSLKPFEQFDSGFETQVYDFLKSKGFSVDTQVGCSGFRIDLGLKQPNSSDYVLAIECDGATYHSAQNARDRDRLRQSILEGMGWKFYRVWSTDWFRNRGIEQERLLEAATEAIEKQPPAAETRKEEPQPVAIFEEKAEEDVFEFPVYQTADILQLASQYLPQDYQGLVRAVLDVEAPLSEDLFLKRMLWYYNREKVTSVVRRIHGNMMFGCQGRGIVRKNGFLYLKEGPEIRFRRQGEIERDIKQIAPEELADGLWEILKQNVTAEKSGLYRSLIQQCGISRLTKGVTETLDQALKLLDDKVEIEGEQVSLK